MSMLAWAKREIELAIKDKNADEYYKMCCQSALKAFQSLLDDGHSGYSIQVTKNILNHLIDGVPLSPLRDTPDIWSKVDYGNHGYDTYQCNRRLSLFKYVYPNGDIKYYDTNQFICIDVHNHQNVYCNGLASRIASEYFPITMSESAPYIPSSKPTEIYCETKLHDPKNGDFDTKGILYCITPNGERIDINRYFKEGDPDWIEIDQEEYEMRGDPV